jgi:hypothetical protein
MHLPTRAIPCEAFMRFLIEELDVRETRPDWDGVLRRKHSGPPRRAR